MTDQPALRPAVLIDMADVDDILGEMRANPREKFMRGGCGYFALALHDIDGFILYKAGRLNDDGTTKADHVCLGIVDPTGQTHLADIRGCWPASRYLPSLANDLFADSSMPMKLEQIEQHELEELLDTTLGYDAELDTIEGQAILSGVRDLVEGPLRLKLSPIRREMDELATGKKVKAW